MDYATNRYAENPQREKLQWEDKPNAWVPENIKSEWTLESRLTKAALTYDWHVIDESSRRKCSGHAMTEEWRSLAKKTASAATIDNDDTES